MHPSSLLLHLDHQRDGTLSNDMETRLLRETLAYSERDYDSESYDIVDDGLASESSSDEMSDIEECPVRDEPDGPVPAESSATGLRFNNQVRTDGDVDMAADHRSHPSAQG